jgi:DNA-binding transcriptional ArsR family regulator
LTYISLGVKISGVEAFGVLGDPVRRRILELLASGERSAGDVAGAIRADFGLTQPAVSRHLRVLRESGFASVRSAGTRRLYVIDTAGLEDAESWLADLRGQWSRRLDAPATELARGRRRNRIASNQGDDER